MLLKAIELNPDSILSMNLLGRNYEEQGRHQDAKPLFSRANSMGLNTHREITRVNYNRLKEMLDSSNIALVCVQYPLNNVDELKQHFEVRENMIFVDNNMSFAEAVRKEGYDAYFIDKSLGIFGHCSPKGNMLLARNIADAVVNEYFR